MVLIKGLTFVPTPRVNLGMKKQLLLEMQQYHRRLLLTAYFKHRKEREFLPFTPKAHWTPKLSQVPNQVRKVIRADRYAFRTLPWNATQQSNLSIPERRALAQLKSDRDVVIKPADKGSAVVIMDRTAYVREAHRQLHQPQYYRKLDQPLSDTTGPEVRKILTKLKDEGFINRKQLTYLFGPDSPRQRRFYLLPKIHKDPETWSVPFRMPPGRPIVSDCGSDTYATAEYIEYFLNPLSTRHPSYVRDTYDFLDKIRTIDLPDHCLLFTIDVDSLYTNIDTTAGLAAVREWFDRYPDRHRPDQHLLDLLKINLIQNDFEFNSEFFLQVKGTAMGKKFAPSYANIFMAKWEEGALATWPVKPLHYYRFLDDIWGVWTESELEFRNFINHLNQFDHSIKVKHTLHSSEVTFLDTVTYKGNDFAKTHHLQFKVHFKETDTHALLHKKSFHPKHTFKGVIKSQLLRFQRISSKTEEFWWSTRTLFGALRRRGYSRSFLRGCLKGFLTCNTQRKQIQLEDVEMIPMVSTFSNSSVILNRRVKENFYKFMGEGEILHGHRIISAYKKNPNLRDLLVRATLTPPLQHKRRDKLGLHFLPKRYIANPRTKEVFTVGDTFNPRVPNCVYLIYCNKCKLQYVGETVNTLIIRMRQHTYNIRKGRNVHTWVVKHFRKHGLGELKCMVLEHNKYWTRPARQRVEGKWIGKLGSQHPWGLNEK